MRVTLEIKGDSTELIITNMECALALLPSLIELVIDLERDSEEKQRLFDLLWQRKEDGIITTRGVELESGYDADATKCHVSHKYLYSWRVVIESNYSHARRACRLLSLIDNNVLVIDEE